MKYLFLMLTISLVVSCGGGGSASSTSSSSNSAPVITGMQGDLSAIEPIDLD